ncbi:MAG: hypothetical protein LBD99_00575 [Candidatus Margulisbacteria bacterium]|jgi:signal transduction histidine kinase|nr:hypothetical protein [Candidatus Margulisiibacteriota bacterium]
MLDNAVLEKMTSRLVHDVRTPLTVLNMLYAAMQTYLPGAPQMREELEILKEEIAKIDKITTQYREELRKIM